MKLSKSDKSKNLIAAQKARDNSRMNLAESKIAEMAKSRPVNCPHQNRFTPGLYSREIFMPKGTMLTSKIHKTTHQFVVISGACLVWSAEDGVKSLTAGHVGITIAGTRRILYILEDCRWITFHPTQETDIEKIESELILPHNIPGTEDAEPLSALGKRELSGFNGNKL